MITPKQIERALWVESPKAPETKKPSLAGKIFSVIKFIPSTIVSKVSHFAGNLLYDVVRKFSYGTTSKMKIAKRFVTDLKSQAKELDLEGNKNRSEIEKCVAVIRVFLEKNRSNSESQDLLKRLDRIFDAPKAQDAADVSPQPVVTPEEEQSDSDKEVKKDKKPAEKSPEQSKEKVSNNRKITTLSKEIADLEKQKNLFLNKRPSQRVDIERRSSQLKEVEAKIAQKKRELKQEQDKQVEAQAQAA